MCCQCFSKGSPHFFLSAAVAQLVRKGLHGSGGEGCRPALPALPLFASLVKHKCPFSGVTKEGDAVIWQWTLRVTRSCFYGTAHRNRSEKPLPSLAPPPTAQHKDASAGLAPSWFILRTCGTCPYHPSGSEAGHLIFGWLTKDHMGDAAALPASRYSWNVGWNSAHPDSCGLDFAAELKDVMQQNN